MVGTPSSTGCSTCRKRKKKCGEEKPECRACIEAGWKCPGYGKQWKFVDENKQMSSYFGKKKYIFEGGAGELDDLKPASETAVNLDNAGGGYNIDEVHSVGSGSFHVGIQSGLSASSNAGQTSSLFSYILTDAKCQSLFSLNRLGDFVLSIPERIGQNAALDAVADCICRIFVDFLNGNASATQETLAQYTESLRALQECVQDPDLRTQSNTMCASVLVQICELILSPDEQDADKWFSLSKGTELLIQECGPERFEQAFENSLLWANRELFIIRDLMSGESCWLAQAPWRALFRYAPGYRPAPGVELKDRTAEFILGITGQVSNIMALLSPTNAAHELAASSLAEQQQQLAELVGTVKQRIEIFYTHGFQAPLRKRGLLPFEHLTKERMVEAYMADQYRVALFVAFDCALNLVLAKLGKILVRLREVARRREGVGQDLSGPSSGDGNSDERERYVQRLAAFLQATSPFEAKPLEYLLARLGPDDGYLDSPVLAAD